MIIGTACVVAVKDKTSAAGRDRRSQEQVRDDLTHEVTRLTSDLEKERSKSAQPQGRHRHRPRSLGVFLYVFIPGVEGRIRGRLSYRHLLVASKSRRWRGSHGLYRLVFWKHEAEQHLDYKTCSGATFRLQNMQRSNIYTTRHAAEQHLDYKTCSGATFELQNMQRNIIWTAKRCFVVKNVDYKMFLSISGSREIWCERLF